MIAQVNLAKLGQLDWTGAQGRIQTMFTLLMTSLITSLMSSFDSGTIFRPILRKLDNSKSWSTVSFIEQFNRTLANIHSYAFSCCLYKY